jgi:hypothetical protein
VGDRLARRRHHPLVWGVLLILAPIPGIVVMTWWVGAFAIIFGGALIALAFRLKRRRDEPTTTLAHA